MNEHVFALDIGTQSVTGILLKRDEATYRVIDYCIKQHPERSMLDGQIQNVVQVAKVISDVKNELEEKHGTLEKVCVAAAGRALKTVKAEKTVNVEEQPIASEEDVKHLELGAVQHALGKLTERNGNKSHYHCVGYSVLHYKLDGEKIGSFIDQVGSEAMVEVIATFLPKVVVESLLSALERANLKMEALTLEPIAAIHVLVPESMRRLNVALIDIGAGTSDIAISSNGTVAAYGMVPIAGDEVTEAMSDEYLLDFKIAERAKREIVNEKQTSIEDILGFPSTVTYENVVTKIDSTIDQLSQRLAQEVRLLNGKQPQAVMLIGGGSLTPEIDKKIAKHLQLPPNRVARRGMEAIQLLKHDENLPAGPDFVTPIGIAISATEKPLHYVTVYVNDKVTFMFETKKLTVGDALIHAGIDVNTYYGKIGLAQIVTVNEKPIALRGKFGEPPKIFVNGKEAAVDSDINAWDRITIQKGKDGAEPSFSLKQIVGKKREIPFFCNDERYKLKPRYLLNGKEANENDIVQDKDDIAIELTQTIGEFLKTKEEYVGTKAFFVIVNGRKMEIKEGTSKIIVNGQPTAPDAHIKEGDKISIVPAQKITVATLFNQLNKSLFYKKTVIFNGEAIELMQTQVEIKRNGATLQEDDELFSGDQLTYTEKKIRPFIFQDIFRHVEINPLESGSYALYRNGEPTSFHETIIDGDRLELVWK